MGRFLRAGLRPNLHPDLVSAGAFDAIAEIADRFPERISELYGFECSLTAPEPVADFLLCVTNESGGHEDLAGAAGEWPAVRSLASPWDKRIENLWLEFDMEGVDPARAAPSLFFGLLPDSNPETHPAHVRETLLGILGPRRSLGVDRVAETIARIPFGGRVFQVGAMLARGDAPVRLCIRGLSPETLPGFLSDAGWNGAAGVLEETLRDLAPLAQRVDLDLDVPCTGPERVLPKIGLELRLASRVGGGPSPWIPILDRCRSLGIVRQEKCDALLLSEGVAHEFSHRAAWPRHLLEGSALARGGGYYSAVVWGVHHIKVVIDAQGARSAKAYLAVEYQWARFGSDGV